MQSLDPDLNETIPAVSPDDLKALCRFIQEFMPKDCGAFGEDLVQHVCSPGVNFDALMWRYQHLQLASMIGKEDENLAPFIHDGQPDERLIDLFATFQFRVTREEPNGTYALNWRELELELRLAWTGSGQFALAPDIARPRSTSFKTR